MCFRSRKGDCGLHSLSPVLGGEGRGGGLCPPNAKKAAPHPNPLSRVQGRGDRMKLLVLAASFLCVLTVGCSDQRGHGDSPAGARAVLPPTQPARVLHVVADPNNLPFSNDKLEGFENRLAELIAREMGAKVEYAWRAQRRGFFRHAFQDDGGDVVLGVPAGFERTLNTAPYYR